MVRILLAGLFLITNILTQAQHWSEMVRNGNVPFSEIEGRYQEIFDENGFSKSTGWKQFGRMKHFVDARMSDDGYFLNGDATLKAFKAYKDGQVESKFEDVANWTTIGPFDIPTNGGAGRVNCIAFDPSNSSTYYVGAPSGGLWKTTNNGISWMTTTDELSSIGISDIIVDPINPNIIIIASGDRDADDTYSAGILRSTDGGNTWNSTNLSWAAAHQKQANALAMNPSNHDILFAATSSGLYKSIDNGLNWSNVKNGNYKDIQYHPNDPNTLYLKTSTQVFRSDDGGANFNNLISPTYSTSVGRIRMAVTADAPDNLYIVAAKNNSWALEGVYVSSNKGSTYTKVQGDYPNMLDGTTGGSGSTGQAWYDLDISVSPLDKDEIYVGGINIWRSLTGGTNWSQVAHWLGNGGHPYVHADIHSLEFNANGHLYACTDGGVFVTTNKGGYWTDISDGLSIAQIYKLGVSQTNPNKMITGWQDNGSNLYSSSNWARKLGGDGMECIINPVNANYMYASIYYGDIRRSATGGGSFSPITNSINETGAWVTPYVLDPNNSTTIYAGFTNVWKGTNHGNYWTKISSFSSANKLQNIAVAASNSSTIYASTSTTLFKTNDGGSTWANVTSGINGYGNITSIVVDPNDEHHVWVSKSGYFSHKKVYESTDGGTNWNNVSGTLPNLPVNTLVYQKNSAHGLYAGMDVGVYYKDTITGDWIPFMKNLPNVIISELEIIESTSELVAATYGRGVWKTQTWDLLNDVEDPTEDMQQNLNVYPVPSEGIIHVDLSLFMNEEIEISIVNMMGQTIVERNMRPQNQLMDFDLSSYGKGIYMIQLRKGNSHSSAKVVIH